MVRKYLKSIFIYEYIHVFSWNDNFFSTLHTYYVCSIQVSSMARIKPYPPTMLIKKQGLEGLRRPWGLEGLGVGIIHFFSIPF